MSTEYDALKKAEDEAKKQFDKDIDDALKQKETDKRKDDADAALKKYREALDAAMKAYLDALAKAKSAFADFVNKEIERKVKKEIDQKLLTNMAALVAEAQSLEIYKKADDCKKENPGNCASSLSKDKTTINCDIGTCKCKCHAYVSLGGQLFRAEGLIHGAHFGSCPISVNETFGGGTIQCKCVDK